MKKKKVEVQASQGKPKKKKGCLIAVLVVLVIVILSTIFGKTPSENTVDQSANEPTKLESVDSQIDSTQESAEQNEPMPKDQDSDDVEETNTVQPDSSAIDNSKPTTSQAATDEEETSPAQSSEGFMLDLNSASIGTQIDTADLDLRFGDLLSVTYGGDGIVVVKGKITPSYSNKTTINQNYFSVCDLIKNHGFDSCTELQYWAVADMQSGDESKVISFTLNSDTIKGVKNENIIENQLGDYVNDLYILPSLTK